MKIGYIGLGKMGLNMVERLLEKGNEIVAYAPDAESRRRAASFGADAVESLRDMIQHLPAPRTLWLMIPYKAVDEVFSELLELLEPGDTIIDGGNSPYKESIQRSKEALEKTIRFMDVGVSGGPSGAKNGACLMVGGEKEVFDEYVPLLRDIAVEDGYGYMGGSGAGHFVKMVHNGIEYGMMQSIAEGFAVMKASPLQLNLQEISRVYDHQSVITSRLVRWLENAFKEHGVGLDDISGSVSQSGEGLWMVDAANELGVPVAIIEHSVRFREQSQENPSFTGKIVSALRNQFGGHEVSKQ